MTYRARSRNWIAGGVVSALAAASVGGFGLDAFAARADSGQQNPDLTATCGSDIIIVLDESASIASPTNFAPLVESAVQGLVTGLTGTGSRIRFVEFSTNARDVTLSGGTGFQVVDEGFAAQVDSYLNGSGLPQIGTSYNPSTAAGSEIYTNWEAGLFEAANPGSPTTGGVGAPLVLFITDGNPNTIGTAGNSVGAGVGNTPAGNDLGADAAIQEMAALQAAGGHVLSIAVGAASSDQTAYDRLTNVTEPGTFEQWSGTGEVLLTTTDAMRVTYFDGLQTALDGVLFAHCGSSLTINKTDDAGNPIAERSFGITVKSLSGGTALQWQSPSAAPTGAVAPSTRTVATGPTGIANFKWTPGTVASPQPWNSVVAFSETLPAGWTAAPASCVVNNDTLNPMVMNPTIAGSVATYGGTAGFAINRGDVVVCDVVNNRPAQITVVKQADPADGTDFTFTTTSTNSTDPLPTSFTLDVDADATLPNSRVFTVDPGTYTITESAPAAGVYWTLQGLNCSMERQSPESSVSSNLASRTSTLTLLPADQATCTYLNDDVPAPQLTIAKTANPRSFLEATGVATYGLTITNPGTEQVRITALRDVMQLNGMPATQADLDLAVPSPGAAPGLGGLVTANTCDELVALPTILAAGQVASCSFTMTYSGRNAGQTIDDTVTVTGVDVFNRAVSNSSLANVTVLDRPPVISVDKQNVEVAILAPGGVATYNVFVSNQPNASEPITILSLEDQMYVDAVGTPAAFAPFGSPLDVTAVAGAVTSTNCATLIGQTLAPGITASCRFSVDTRLFAPAITLNAGDVLRNDLTVSAQDDELTVVTGHDVADRPVLLIGTILDVWKSDGRATISEPGSQVTYTLWIDNAGVEGQNPAITVTSITDVVKFRLSDLDPVGPIVGTVTITTDGVATDFTPASGVSLVSTSCLALIGRVLQPSSGAPVAYPGIGQDPARNRPANASARSECTITLQLPGDSGNQYDDTVTVTAIDPGESVLTGSNGANTPVVGVAPVLALVKTASTPSLAEPGGPVIFTFAVTNNSVSTDPVTITKLSDSVFGDLFAVGRTGTNCRSALSGRILQPGATASCTLTAPVLGDAGFIHTNLAVVTGVDDEGTETTHSDDAVVTITDALPSIDVVKTAVAPLPTPVQISELGGDVTYRIDVRNTSVESVTLISLIDDKFGNLNGKGTCVIGGVIEVAASYSCTFTGFVAQSASETAHRNTVTAHVVDDENNDRSDLDDETVPFVLFPPRVTIDKSDADVSVNEPGGPVTYFVTVANPLDAVENIVRITSLTDTITYSDRATPVTLNLLDAPTGGVVSNTCPGVVAAALPLVPGETFSCAFAVTLTGTAQLVSDAVHVVVVDDDTQTATSTGRESTPIVDVPPAVTIVKSANPAVVVKGAASIYTFVITNGTTAEPFHVMSLKDDKFGDLTAACWGTNLPVLAPKGQPGDSVTCTQSLVPAFDASGVHTNVATVTGGDDELITRINNPGEGTPPLPFSASDNETVRVGTEPALLATMTSLCVADAPFVSYEITAVGFTPVTTPTLSFYDLDGRLLKTVAVSSFSGRVIYPGAQVDSTGKATDWPGWKLENNRWAVDPTDSRLRDGVRIVATVNPTAEAIVSYPTASPACASPPPPGQLPVTGSNSTERLLRAALILLITGGALAALTRRRRRIAT